MVVFHAILNYRRVDCKLPENQPVLLAESPKLQWNRFRYRDAILCATSSSTSNRSDATEVPRSDATGVLFAFLGSWGCFNQPKKHGLDSSLPHIQGRSNHGIPAFSKLQQASLRRSSKRGPGMGTFIQLMDKKNVWTWSREAPSTILDGHIVVQPPFFRIAE